MTGESWELPENTGRTIDYLILRVCERFRMPKCWFDHLSNDEQTSLLGFEDLRQAEEAASPGCALLGGGKE